MKPSVEILVGDALSQLALLPDGCLQCCVTSPPYWGLRDYGVEGQLGLERTPDEYVENMVEVFREVRRVLRDDGTLWLNLGDTYASAWPAPVNRRNVIGQEMKGGIRSDMRPNMLSGCLKEKDLVGIPWRVALALQADGWYLRSEIIWHKPNPMPESVRDRPTKAHEQIFLLAKSARYFYDADAVREEFADKRQGNPGTYKSSVVTDESIAARMDTHRGGVAGKGWNEDGTATGRNRRSVWTVTTKPFKAAHFATFPPDLIDPCIKAGTSARGACPDCGTPWNRVVEKAPEPETFWQPGCRCYNTPKLPPYRRQQEDETDEAFAQQADETRTARLALLKEWEPLETVPGIVLDPFFGAGTTGLVALANNQHCLGIELNPEYVEIAKKRIGEE